MCDNLALALQGYYVYDSRSIQDFHGICCMHVMDVSFVCMMQKRLYFIEGPQESAWVVFFFS